MQQKSCHRLIYKLNSKFLKKNNWDVQLDLYQTMREHPDRVVALSESQALRFINEINGVDDVNGKVFGIFKKLKDEKKKPRSRETKATVRALYDSLYSWQFQKDYVCVIMDSNADYDRANQGFKINGITYKRLLGTNGGIKNSTIVYVNQEIYPELKRRLDNGRNKLKEIVPAKLEAYQALICSGSTPLPTPRIIVVKDCCTTFVEDVITLNDEQDGEPVMTNEKNYTIAHDASDGYGLMTPEYSIQVNKWLTGKEEPLAGMNTRYAWTKGMVYTFDFVEFAKRVAGTYIIKDVWGDERDVRDTDVILTESMLKLWDSYVSWEDYKNNCDANGYQFSTPKITPEKLENVRDTNYQFLQSYDFTDDELQELCKPTFDEINDAMGMDYRKSLTFLAGYSLTEDNAFDENLDYAVRALMANEEMINDSFIRRRVRNMIEKRIEMAKRGAIRINANFAMISGDPYALCESAFGLEIKGLLPKGYVYHKYWIDNGDDEIVCFRAPMTSANNIKKMKLCKETEAAYWYRYMTTVLIYNAWDTACDAMNGADFDGDTNMTTNNSVLLKNTKDLPTIICMQRKAAKCVPTEEDIVQANKLAFNDDIGTITNYITSMFDVQAGFERGSKEWDTLQYRIMCGQQLQQNSIDRAKGIIAKPMPSYWYNFADTVAKDGDDSVTRKQKQFNQSIVASRKPYFMTYVYPTLKTKNDTFNRKEDNKAAWKFKSKYGIKCVRDVYACKHKTKAMNDFIAQYEKRAKIGYHDCTINKMCFLAENVFAKPITISDSAKFDYSILKSNVVYSKETYNRIYGLYREYRDKMAAIQRENRMLGVEKDSFSDDRIMFINIFKQDAMMVCSNADELCDVVVDICYRTEGMKSFAWDVAGETMLRNILRNSGNTIHFPIAVDYSGEFTFAGRNFVMMEKVVSYEE